MACPQCGNPYVKVAAGKVCNECRLANKWQRSSDEDRGASMSGHLPHDDPGPHGDYGEVESEREDG